MAKLAVSTGELRQASEELGRSHGELELSVAERTRVAVLVSGAGSNLRALLDAAEAPGYPARIVLVISNRPSAGALAIAR